MFISQDQFARPDGQRHSLALNSTFRAMAKRVRFGSIDIQHATIEEVLWGLALARETLPVTSDDHAAQIHAHNGDCFRIVREHDFARSSMMAYLPLNSAGLAALVDGRFDTTTPSTEMICEAGVAPEALYLWLIYTPGHMTAGLRLIEELERYAPGVPIFTRPANSASARIGDRCGFQRANELFPAVTPDMRVVLPLAAERKASRCDVRVVRSVDELFKVFAVRTATYMSEQSCHFEEEFDGNDLCATHLIGDIDGEPAGCVRIRYFGDFAKLERLAVRPEHRRSRLMFRLVRAAFEHCRRKGFSRLYAHAREDLIPAWERFGARLVDNRQPFMFSGVRFREMMLDLTLAPNSIRFGCDPIMLIRPEGEWDRLGPIDRGQLVAHFDRQQHIDEHVRRFAQ